MGALCSRPPADRYSTPPIGDGANNANHAGPAPDFGLSATHKVMERLGAGAEGETWLCKDLESQQKVAVKLIKRPIPVFTITGFHNEMKIQADLGQGHVHIVRAHEVILTRSYLALVMDYVPGGSMVRYVTERRETMQERGGRCLEEDEARYFFRQLIGGMEYCHQHKVAHRDLKLDNTLLDDHEPPWLKLCDFGFAKHWQAHRNNMETRGIGTQEYMGPEMVGAGMSYDGAKVDVWAAGVLLYVMLVGDFPFEPQDNRAGTDPVSARDAWVRDINSAWRCVHAEASNAFNDMSEELQSLLDAMFEVDPLKRASIEQIKAHPWYNKPLPAKYEISLKELEQKQQKIRGRVRSGSCSVEERDKALAIVLQDACREASADEQLQRLSLANAEHVFTVLASVGPTMAPLAEE